MRKNTFKAVLSFALCLTLCMSMIVAMPVSAATYTAPAKGSGVGTNLMCDPNFTTAIGGDNWIYSGGSSAENVQVVEGAGVNGANAVRIDGDVDGGFYSTPVYIPEESRAGTKYYFEVYVKASKPSIEYFPKIGIATSAVSISTGTSKYNANFAGRPNADGSNVISNGVTEADKWERLSFVIDRSGETDNVYPSFTFEFNVAPETAFRTAITEDTVDDYVMISNPGLYYYDERPDYVDNELFYKTNFVQDGYEHPGKQYVGGFDFTHSGEIGNNNGHPEFATPRNWVGGSASNAARAWGAPEKQTKAAYDVIAPGVYSYGAYNTPIQGNYLSMYAHNASAADGDRLDTYVVLDSWGRDVDGTPLTTANAHATNRYYRVEFWARVNKLENKMGGTNKNVAVSLYGSRTNAAALPPAADDCYGPYCQNIYGFYGESTDPTQAVYLKFDAAGQWQKFSIPFCVPYDTGAEANAGPTLMWALTNNVAGTLLDIDCISVKQIRETEVAFGDCADPLNPVTAYESGDTVTIDGMYIQTTGNAALMAMVYAYENDVPKLVSVRVEALPFVQFTFGGSKRGYNNSFSYDIELPDSEGTYLVKAFIVQTGSGGVTSLVAHSEKVISADYNAS